MIALLELRCNYCVHHKNPGRLPKKHNLPNQLNLNARFLQQQD